MLLSDEIKKQFTNSGPKVVFVDSKDISKMMNIAREVSSIEVSD